MEAIGGRTGGGGHKKWHVNHLTSCINSKILGVVTKH
jgi:hypothetical protein